MEWEVFQRYMNNLYKGGATVVIDRKKLELLNNQSLKTPGSRLQDIAPSCLGVEDARWTGFVGCLYWVKTSKSHNEKRISTINLIGRLVYSEDDVDQSISKRIIVPVEAIESISFA